MGQTFLTHTPAKRCGGNVVIDASSTAKLIAPSFAINSQGIGDLTLDINISNGGNLIPVFMCTKCGEILEKDVIGRDLSACCQVCGKENIVSDLYVNPKIACICINCIGEIKRTLAGEASENPRIRDFISVYSLKPGMRNVSLEKVLASPIHI